MSLLLAVPLPLVGAAGPIQGLLTRQRAYRALAFRTVIGQGLGTLVGIGAALDGAGAWALVLQQCVISGAGALALLVRSPTRPRLTVSWPRLRELARIGLPLTASTLVYHCRYRLFALLIGATAGAATLGQVHMAFRLIDAVRELVFTAQWRLMLPMLSEQQRRSARTACRDGPVPGMVELCGFPTLCGHGGLNPAAGDAAARPGVATLRHRLAAADRVDGVAVPCIPRRRRRHCPRRAALYADRQHRRHHGHRGWRAAAAARQPLAGGAGLAWCPGIRQSLCPVGERTCAGDDAAATSSSRRPPAHGITGRDRGGVRSTTWPSANHHRPPGCWRFAWPFSHSSVSRSHCWQPRQSGC